MARELKNDKKKSKTVNFMITVGLYDDIQKCCEMLDISQSEFIRQAVTKEVYRTYENDTIRDLHNNFNFLCDEVKKIGLELDYKQKLEDIENLVNFIKFCKFRGDF